MKLKTVVLSIIVFLGLSSFLFAAGRLGIATGQYGSKYVSIMKFGDNQAVGDEYEDINGIGGNFSYLSTPTAIEVLSASVNDAAEGTGARTLTVFSLDADYNFQTETVTLNGETPVALVKPVLRVWRATVDTTGSAGTAAATLTIRVGGAGATQAVILNGTEQSNQTLTTLFTVPDGYYGLLCCMFSGCEKGDDAEVNFQVRPFGGTFSTKFRQVVYQSTAVNSLVFPILVPPRADIRVRGKAGSGSIHLFVGYEVLLVDERSVSQFPGVAP